MDRRHTRQLLQNVTRLVEKPDIKSLEMSLIATLSKIIKATSIRIWQLHPDPDAPSQRLLVSADPYERVRLDSAPAFVECLNIGAKAIVLEDERLLAVHPIKVRNDVVGFLAIECEENDPHDQEVVSILLEFYRNYASLLYDNERDVLTGLLNRKTFYEKVIQVIGSQRDALPSDGGRDQCCLAVIDIDHFKNVNDQYGHLVGDETLVLFARDMVDAFRGSDLLFRMGGEEFVVLLREVNADSAVMVLERLRRTVEKRDFPQLGTLTISIGASFVLPGDLPNVTLDRADKALYYAKENGRNQVCVYETLTAEGKLSVVQRESDIQLF